MKKKASKEQRKQNEERKYKTGNKTNQNKKIK